MNNLPTTISACHDLICKQERELIDLKTRQSSRGVAADLIRDPINFTVIDVCLHDYAAIPFLLGDVFDAWMNLTGLVNETQYVRSTLRQQFNDLLRLNAFIVHVGGNGRSKLWRIAPSYDFALSRSTTLSWRKLGSVEGTYLIPNGP